MLFLYGRLEAGAPFLIREHREVPCFYIRATDEAAARGALGPRASLQPTDQRTLRGQPVLRIEAPTPPALTDLHQRLQRAGIPTHEADLSLVSRYLIRNDLRGALDIYGPASEHGGLLVFDDPQVAPASYAPALSLLSLDIETDPTAQRLLSIALYGTGRSTTDEVLLLTLPGAACPEGATPCASEAALLRALGQRVQALDPDILLGWNVVDFDLTVLLRLCTAQRVPLFLGRGGRGADPDPRPGTDLIIRPASGRGFSRASLPGRVVLDGIHLLRYASIRMEQYSLDAVARSVLGEGKLLSGDHRADEILRLFEHDRERFVAYNRTDARLAAEIVARLHLIDLSVQQSLLTGVALGRAAAGVAGFEQLYLSRLYPLRVVAPDAPGPDRREDAAPDLLQGGHVLDPQPGLYRDVLVLDFRSLYPSVIRTFHIDPLGYLPDPQPHDDALIAPGGAAFRRGPGILPALLDELFPLREAARRAGDEVRSHALKILMNAFYGVLGTRSCRFYSPAISNAITGFGREVLLWCRDRSQALGFPVLYGDTDSLFLAAPAGDDVRGRGEALAARLTRELAQDLQQRYRVESRLELRLAEVYLRLLLPRVRHGGGGARKRYAGLVADPRSGARRVLFTGMEAVRSDWTELAREVQRELCRRLFHDEPVEDYLRGVVAALRRGELDDKLVYRKRKGPQPYGLSHEHYLEHQLRPVAEPVLALLDLDFGLFTGAGQQLRLFS